MALITPVECETKALQPSELQLFCTKCVPDFTPLGGGRPDNAVVACVAVSLYAEGLPADVIMAPDVLDTALAVLCAPHFVADATELVALFQRCPVVSVRLRTTKKELLENLKTISDSSGGRLAVTMELDDSVTVLPYQFMSYSSSVTRVDLRRTSIQRTDGDCFHGCPQLTSVKLPKSLTLITGTIDGGFAGQSPQLTNIVLPDSVAEIKGLFFMDSKFLRNMDLKNTALERIGYYFCADCPLLTSVVLPDTLTEVKSNFLYECSSVRTINLSNTALRTIGSSFAGKCGSLESVFLPDTVTKVGGGFLEESGSVEVVSNSRAVKERAKAAARYSFERCEGVLLEIEAEDEGGCEVELEEAEEGCEVEMEEEEG